MSTVSPYYTREFHGDDVVAQERLLREHVGIERLALVTGGSMGAQQTYERAVRFPGKVLPAAPIAGPRHGRCRAAARVAAMPGCPASTATPPPARARTWPR
jgi:homoserine acetyltransferase